MNVGDAVIYTNTGTKGIIQEIKKEGEEAREKIWALLDNGMYYDILLLKPSTLKGRSESKSISVDEIERRLKEKEDMLSEPTSDEFCDGGG